LPVLTTTNTPFAIIEKLNAGWIVNSNYIELKLVLHKILETSEKELIIKKKNSIKLARRFLWSKIFPYYINLYKKIMKI
jgi:hypothetical protein